MFELFLPPLCAICDKSIHHDVLCQFCLPKYLDFQAPRCWCCYQDFYFEDPEDKCLDCLADQESLFASKRFIWDYSAVVRDFILVMKYQSDSGLFKVANRLLLRALPYLYHQPYWDLVVPIPSSKTMFLKRGYNQVEKVIQGMDLIALDMLLHQGRGKPQAVIKTPQERVANVADVFYCNQQSQIEGKSILLVDDIVTTGATASAAARKLLLAGAAQIHLLSLTSKK